MASPISALASVAKPAIEDLAGQIKTAGKDWFGHFVLSGEAALKRYGAEGEAVAGMVREQRDTGAAIAGNAHAGLADAYKSLDTNARSNARAVMQGQATPLSVNVANAVKQTRTIQSQLVAELRLRGVNVIDKGTGQLVPITVNDKEFPSILKDQVFYEGSKLQNDLVDHLIQTGQTQGKSDSIEAIKRYAGGIHGQKGVQLIHNFPFQVPDKFLETDPQLVFSEYANAAGQKISMHDVFGPKNINIKTLQDAIGTTSYQGKEFVSHLMDMVQFGYSGGRGSYYQGHTNTERLIKDFENLTKLGRMALGEPFQANNTVLMTNVKSMYESLGDYTKSRASATEFAVKSGALISETVQDLKDFANGKTASGNLFYYTGFNFARRANLVLAANAGKHYAQELAGKLQLNPTDSDIIGQLKSIGIDATQVLNKGLAPEDLLRAGRRVAEGTQFMNSPLDMPIGWHSSPIMRTLTLYKNFPYNQGRFLISQIKDSYKNGKYGNIAYLATMYPIMGELLGDLETFTRGQSLNDRPQEKLNRISDDMARLGGFGVATGIIGAFNRQNLAQWAGGPVVSDSFMGAQTLYSILENFMHERSRGKAIHSFNKLVTKNIPIVGPTINEKFVKTDRERRLANKKRQENVF